MRVFKTGYSVSFSKSSAAWSSSIVAGSLFDKYTYTSFEVLESRLGGTDSIVASDWLEMGCWEFMALGFGWRCTAGSTGLGTTPVLTILLSDDHLESYNIQHYGKRAVSYAPERAIAFGRHCSVLFQYDGYNDDSELLNPANSRSQLLIDIG